MSDPRRDILNRMQRFVPLVRQPYELLAAELGCREGDVLAAVEAARGEGLLREVAGVFDAAALGYRRALVAMKVAPERLDAAGRAAGDHPGVSHCYAREGEVNLWLTLAVSPRSRLGLEATADLLAERAAATWHALLPTLRRYKLDVRFDAETGTLNGASGEGPGQRSLTSTSAAPMPRDESPSGDESLGCPSPTIDRPAPQIADEQLRAIRALQLDLPARRDPFAAVAAAERLDPDMLLVHGADFLAAGWMRRYAAVLRHRSAGAKANLLVAWEVPAAAADAMGRTAAQSPAVSHCYLRAALRDWPYNLYTMIHGRTRQDCELAAEEIMATTGLARRLDLWTAAEFKKQAVRLFTGDEEGWEARHAPRGQ